MAQTSKAQATARRISTAAAALFAEHGYDDTTIAAVAEASDVAVGTVMLHFGSKSQLATAVFSNQIATLVAGAQKNLPGEDLMGDLDAFVGQFFAWYDERLRYAPDLLRECLFSSGPWAQYYAQTVLATSAAFQNIVTTHTGRADAPAVAEGLIGDYLVVLLQGFRGLFNDVDHQTTHFLKVAATRFPT